MNEPATFMRLDLGDGVVAEISINAGPLSPDQYSQLRAHLDVWAAAAVRASSPRVGEASNQELIAELDRRGQLFVDVDDDDAGGGR